MNNYHCLAFPKHNAILRAGRNLSITIYRAWESLPKTAQAALLSLLLPPCLTQAAPLARSIQFPGYPETGHVQALKAKADRLYASGEFADAHRIYRTRLAFYGDKYAQYMAGYQYLQGQGVPRDLALALAWYRLAAQRGDAALVAARDELAAQLPGDKQLAAAGYFREFDAIFGDARILERLISRDRRELRQKTGSRVGATIGALTIIGPGGTAIAGNQYYEAIQKRLGIRLDALQALKGRVEYGELEVVDTDQQEPSESRGQELD